MFVLIFILVKLSLNGNTVLIVNAIHNNSKVQKQVSKHEFEDKFMHIHTSHHCYTTNKPEPEQCYYGWCFNFWVYIIFLKKKHRRKSLLDAGMQITG